MKSRFYVIKKSAGYACKTFDNESSAREFASLCCKNNGNSNYAVCIYECGTFNEI